MTSFYTYTPYYNSQPERRTYYVQGTILNAPSKVGTQWHSWDSNPGKSGSEPRLLAHEYGKVTLQVTGTAPTHWSNGSQGVGPELEGAALASPGNRKIQRRQIPGPCLSPPESEARGWARHSVLTSASQRRGRP